MLSEDQFNKLYQQAISVRTLCARAERPRREFPIPQDPKPREILKESGVLKLPPETLTENLESAFEDLMERALSQFRGG